MWVATSGQNGAMVAGLPVNVMAGRVPDMTLSLQTPQVVGGRTRSGHDTGATNVPNSGYVSAWDMPGGRVDVAVTYFLIPSPANFLLNLAT